MLAKQWRFFIVEHLFWIPLIPLGFQKEWRCERCGQDPRKRDLGSVYIIVIALIVCLLGFVLFLLIAPDLEPGHAFPVFVWGKRALLGGLTIALPVLLRRKLKGLPKRREVEPLRNDRCLICGARMTDYPQWHCVECGLIRYDS